MLTDEAMVHIPPARETDAEDVAWGLQTAEALWKRGERLDALVWLRRAAQAAGDANDDGRALELARHAAELTESLANAPFGSEAPRSISPPDEEPPAAPGSVPPVGDDPRRSTTSVLPAERVHAGMYDPWAESHAAPAVDAPASAPPSVPPEVGLESEDEDREVVTSIRGPSAPDLPAPERVLPEVSVPPVSARPPVLPAAPKPPPLPPRGPAPLPKPAAPAPPRVRVSEAPLERAASPAAAPSASRPEPEPLDLDSVEAFSDLPDDARAAFAAAATLHPLLEDEEASGFALAYVVSGSFDVAATIVDAPAGRLGAGAVLRARGTIDDGVPMRLICASSAGVVATWSDAAVADAFGTCPWVEDDLRTAADRVLALVGITVGPLGERLDAAIREEIVARLTMRPLAPHEVVVEAGASVPGLLLVGVGELELVGDGAAQDAVGAGEFLFPTEVLGAGEAPATARAGRAGALVLFGDRAIAQELLVTCPPLLEVFAGM